jgi:flagellar biogenesis protein FliO
MKRRLGIAAALLLGALVSSAPSFADVPAEGPPEAAVARAVPEAKGETNADAADPAAAQAPEPAVPGSSSGARSWLARGSSEAVPPAVRESSGTSAGLTLGAVVIVLGLAAAAIYLRFKRQTALPLTPSESRLNVLSSSRVGPKAYAVTAHVGGRVLLLGVTDHSVTNLGWLEPQAPEASGAERERSESPEERDELPDDYPGSALRASKAPPAPVPFATSNELARFREVLRGAVSSRTDLPMRPSYPARPAPDAASTLAAQTTDVVTAAKVSAAKVSVPSRTSLHRTRRGGRDSVAPREPRSAAPSRAPQAIDPSLEGQVAGLRALRNGG